MFSQAMASAASKNILNIETKLPAEKSTAFTIAAPIKQTPTNVC